MNKKLSYKDYLEASKKVLEASEQEKKKYLVMVAGQDFVVYPNVFSPKYFRDTELFANNLPINKGEKMLEIGSGTGIISITAIEKGAKKVVAIDINPEAVRNTKENIKKFQMQDQIEARLGNVYDTLKPNEKFDAIFWNTPFGYIENENITDLEKAVYDPKYKSTKKFILHAKKYLKKDGKVYLGFSSTLGRLDFIKQFTKEANFKMKCIFSAKSTEIWPVKFEIFELK